MNRMIKTANINDENYYFVWILIRKHNVCHGNMVSRHERRDPFWDLRLPGCDRWVYTFGVPTLIMLYEHCVNSL